MSGFQPRSIGCQILLGRFQPAADIGVTTVRTAAIAAVGLRRANSRFQQRLSRLANDLTVAESARCFNEQRS